MLKDDRKNNFSDFRFQSTVRATLASLSHGSCGGDDDDNY